MSKRSTGERKRKCNFENSYSITREEQKKSTQTKRYEIINGDLILQNHGNLLASTGYITQIIELWLTTIHAKKDRLLAFGSYVFKRIARIKPQYTNNLLCMRWWHQFAVASS